MAHGKIVTQYAKMWPRDVCNIRTNGRLPKEIGQHLGKPGVYVLYRDATPYYVGKTAGRLSSRIWAHANQPADSYYNFWNFFSVFVVPDVSHIGELESILIASIPTENRAKPKIPKLKLDEARHGARKASNDSNSAFEDEGKNLRNNKAITLKSTKLDRS
jgi:hypothetical protein